MRLSSIRYLAQDISAFEFTPVEKTSISPHEAGAHFELYLPNGLRRSYSIVNSSVERNSYEIAVAKNRDSRGGSQFIHDELRVGDVLAAGLPRNNFHLCEHAAHSVFIAGGIGITPLWSMIQRLERLGKSWQLFYAARDRESAAYFQDILKLNEEQSGRVHWHFDQEQQNRHLDVPTIMAGIELDAHLYCCGPGPMLDTFLDCTKRRDPSTVHVEYFSSPNSPSTEGGFTVVLARSGQELNVPAGKTILDVLLEAGLDVEYSCMEGICSSCETRVLEGIPEHRDAVLSQQVRESNEVMMICCSGSRSKKLVLDI